MQVEVFYQCPYCFCQVSLLAETQIAEQTFVEDCERCCNPIEFSLRSEPGQVLEIQAEPLGQ